MLRLASSSGSTKQLGVAVLYSASLCALLLANAAAMPLANCTAQLSLSESTGFDLLPAEQKVPCDQETLKQLEQTNNLALAHLQNTQVTPPTQPAAFNVSETLQDEPTNDNGLIPVYCGIMGLVIFSSVVYAVVKQRKQHIKKRNAKTAACASTYRPSLNAHSSNGSSPASVCPCNDINSTTVYLDPLICHNPPPMWYKESKSYLVNDDTIDSLCTLLEDCGVDDKGVEWWRKLATELNFDEKQICAAEYDAPNCGLSPLRVLLTNLAHSNQRWFTVSVLQEALERIGRTDLCSHLLSPAS